MEEGTRERKVKSILTQYPKGIHFNSLYREVKDRMALQTLVKILRDFEERGLVTRDPEKPRKGQKVLYKSTSALQKFEEDKKRIEDFYNIFHIKLIMSDYFAEHRTHKSKLRLDPVAMDISMTEGTVNSILLSGLHLADEYQGKTRRELLEFVVENFLALQQEYFQLLRRHPKVRTKVLKYHEKMVKKNIRMIKKAGPGSLSPERVLSQEEWQMMCEDFSKWIHTKRIRNKDYIKKHFNAWLSMHIR